MRPCLTHLHPDKSEHMTDNDADGTIVATLVRTTTLSVDQAKDVVKVAQNFGAAASHMASVLAQLASQVVQAFTPVMRSLIQSINAFAPHAKELHRHVLTQRLKGLPAPLRSLVRLGHTDLIVIVYDGTTATSKRGRVFVQARAYLMDASLADLNGVMTEVCSLGERRYVERDEAFWHGKGFATMLVCTGSPHVFKAATRQQSATSGHIFSTQPNLQNIPRAALSPGNTNYSVVS